MENLLSSKTCNLQFRNERQNQNKPQYLLCMYYNITMGGNGTIIGTKHNEN